jgi:hypothetical protein
MNTASTTEDGKPIGNKFASLRVQHACVLMLGSLIALPVYAEEPTQPGPKGVIAGALRQIVNATEPIQTRDRAHPHSAPTRGDGPRITSTPAPISSTAPPSNRPPIANLPPRGNQVVGDPSTSVAGNYTAPPPPPPQVQLPSPPAPPSTNPGNSLPSNSANTTAANRPVNTMITSPLPVARGSGPSDTAAPSGTNNAAQFASVNPSVIPPPKRLVDVLPSTQQLSDSMRVMPDLGKGVQQVEAVNQNTQCVQVSLRPDPTRQLVSLVDFSGDGLIVSAVPNSHIQSVFAQAGYAQTDVSQAGRWCIPQATARALLLPAQGTAQAASLLMQTGNGLQLMSQDQWLAHQAAMKPVAANSIMAQPRRAGQTVKKLASKRSTKSFNNVAKNTSNLPPM